MEFTYSNLEKILGLDFFEKEKITDASNFAKMLLTLNEIVQGKGKKKIIEFFWYKLFLILMGKNDIVMPDKNEIVDFISLMNNDQYELTEIDTGFINMKINYIYDGIKNDKIIDNQLFDNLIFTEISGKLKQNRIIHQGFINQSFAKKALYNSKKKNINEDKFNIIFYITPLLDSIQMEEEWRKVQKNSSINLEGRIINNIYWSWNSHIDMLEFMKYHMFQLYRDTHINCYLIYNYNKKMQIKKIFPVEINEAGYYKYHNEIKSIPKHINNNPKKYLIKQYRKKLKNKK